MSKLGKRKTKNILLEDIEQSVVLVEPTRVVWKQEKLRKLLRRKGLGPKMRGRVLVEKTTTTVNDKMLAILVKTGKITVEDLDKVSTIELNKPFIRFFALKQD